MPEPQLISRFAPSPSGRLHAGNIFSYLVCWLLVRRNNGEIILRIEDLDESRSKAQYCDQLKRDLEKLGLYWDREVSPQSTRSDAYEYAFSQLKEMDRVYPCFCTRADIQAASAPHKGEYAPYPRTCFGLSGEALQTKKAKAIEEGRAAAWRIHVEAQSYTFKDYFQGQQSFDLETCIGDSIIKRSNGSFAYQLAVCVDDAAEQVNTVVRGCDLLPSSALQLYIQNLLGYPHPSYAHVPLLITQEGRRIAKRDNDASLDVLMQSYANPEGVLGHIAAISGLIESERAMTAEDLLREAKLDACKNTLCIEWR
ncbi:MAG: tRNA glutamyl-Q(34) synthetase GluQRS [Eggerthellaceae bacterium]|nr:tRNA glutamyl-Q(34) synthetase GluQRS [Eggerthellaceae bacterium]